MENFTPVSALFGGVLIGLAAAILLLFNGRLAGVSGIAGGLTALNKGDMSWRVLFLGGLVVGALGYGLAGLRVDGNDALACYAAERWAANRARANAGPTLIEFFTYRAEGHSTSDDPTGYRSAQERTEWPLGDPVTRLKDHLIAIGEWDEDRQEKMDLEAAEHVKKVTKEAEANGILGHGLHHPFRTMFEDVFEELPWHLKEQSKQAIREREIKFPGGLDQ